MRLALFVLIALWLMQSAYAAEGHMTLLAVSETDSGFKGSTADLYLEIVSGSGRVFIQSFPLTKLDTQISTRFAKEIACQKLDVDCSKYDFFYTIKSDSAIIGGPSAGASVATLTVSLLNGWQIDEKVAVTGTINSGGVIGAVSGIDKKIEAASTAGIKKVLIPKGERETKVNNISVDLVEHGLSLGVDVIEVATIEESVYEFTGQRLSAESVDIDVDNSYEVIMMVLAKEICSRSRGLESAFMNAKATAPGDETLPEEERQAINYTDKADAAFVKGDYYSAASYCFGTNLQYRYMILLLANYSDADFSSHIAELRETITEFESSLPEYETITDLQTYAVVKERLAEAEDNLNLTEVYLEAGERGKAAYSLAYASERFYSAQSWSTFFGKGKKQMDFTNLERPCTEKISEAEERFQYLAYSFPATLIDRSELEQAYSYYHDKNYELCIFRASKAKAEADTALILIGVGNRAREVVGAELEAAKRTIAKQTQEGNFPIVGYSYYEYANSLKEDNVESALLYAEYSLELSNLEMYFNGEVERSRLAIPIGKEVIAAFIAGIIFAFMVFLFMTSSQKKKRRRR